MNKGNLNIALNLMHIFFWRMTMNTQQMVVAASLLIAAAAAMAQQTEFIAPDANFVSTRTRAEVIAELRAAQKEGTYMAGGEEYEGQMKTMARNFRNKQDPAYATVIKQEVATSE